MSGAQGLPGASFYSRDVQVARGFRRMQSHGAFELPNKVLTRFLLLKAVTALGKVGMKQNSRGARCIRTLLLSLYVDVQTYINVCTFNCCLRL